jgi:tetratricopeptide (TPR) repeat protein
MSESSVNNPRSNGRKWRLLVLLLVAITLAVLGFQLYGWQRENAGSRAFQTGNNCLTEGDFDGAIANYTISIQLNPKRVQSHFGRGTAYEKKGDWKRAIADFTEEIKIVPNYARAYCSRGSVYAKQGNLNEAIADYTEAINIRPHFTPDVAEAHYRRGVAYEMKGEGAKAEEDFSEARHLGFKP